MIENPFNRDTDILLVKKEIADKIENVKQLGFTVGKIVEIKDMPGKYAKVIDYNNNFDGINPGSTHPIVVEIEGTNRSNYGPEQLLLTGKEEKSAETPEFKW